MANKTIPQLPEQTGITDNDLLAIVDSGETTTSKIKVSTLLSEAGGGAFQVGDATDSIVPAYSPTSRGVTANTTYVDKLNVNLSNILDIDNGVNNNSIIIGGYGTRGTNTGGLGSAIVGGRNQQLGGNANFVAGQFGSSIAGENNGMVAGRGNVIGGGEYNFIGGGRSVNVTALYSGALGGNGNSVTGNYSTILGGSSNTNSGTESGIVGGNQNGITGIQSVVAGGNQNDITGNYNFVGGGAANDIQGQISAIIGGNINNIGSSGGFSAIVGGKLNNVNHNYSVVLGGQSQTTLQNEEVVVPKLRTTQYASLNFSGDTAAAAGGVQLGEFYHDNGAVRVRIT